MDWIELKHKKETLLREGAEQFGIEVLLALDSNMATFRKLYPNPANQANGRTDKDTGVFKVEKMVRLPEAVRPVSMTVSRSGAEIVIQETTISGSVTTKLIELTVENGRVVVSGQGGCALELDQLSEGILRKFLFDEK